MRALIAAVLTVAAVTGSALAQEDGGDLSMRGVFALAERPPAQFAREWSGRYQHARRAEGANLAALRAERARGFIDYAYFHWRETGEHVRSDWRPLNRAVRAVDINDPALLALLQHQEFLQAWLRHQARRALDERADLQTGDNRWLRARFFVAETQVRDNQVRRFLLRTALAAHIEDNTATGVPELIDRFAALTDAPEVELAPLRQAAQEDLALRDGHRIEVYKHIGGVGLEAHIIEPAALRTGPRPALIWFHGGSWTSGSWAHCPVFCRLAREQGYATIQIEYRTNDRFNTTPMDAVEDARDALAWVRTNAAALGVDPEHLVVGGFSSGGSIATFLASTSAPREVRGALLVSACTAPLNDSWSRRMLEHRYSIEELSPAAHLDSADPAILAIHGDGDEMCPFVDTGAFIQTAQAAGVDAHLATLNGASHFFVFNNPPARALAAEQATAFLGRWR